MPPFPLSRTLYSSLLQTAQTLHLQLIRFPLLHTQELQNLRQASIQPLPKELRGLFDIHQSPLPPSLPSYISLLARRISTAAQTPEFSGLDTAVGFAALRHMNSRIDALRHLVVETASDAERFGIRVEAASFYQGSDRERYFFRYSVRIENGNVEPVQLLTRAWTIRDLEGRVTNVEGPGVVGVFPRLQSGESYEYSSGVPLNTPVGTQSGHYVFIVGGKEQDKDLKERMLQVPIAPFSYRTPSMEGRKGRGVGGGGGRGKGRRRNDDPSRRV